MAKGTHNEEENQDQPLINMEPVEKGKYVVAQEFRDIVDFSKVHSVGDDVSDFDKKRLAELLAAGIVTAVEKKK